MKSTIPLKLARMAAQLVGPLTLLLMSVLVRMKTPELLADWAVADDTRRQVELASVVFEWIACGWTLNRVVLIFVWEGLIRQRLKASPPRVLVDLSAVIIWALLASLMLSLVFEQSLTGLMATSTVSLGVAGFAVRELISDFFAGIALSVERPFVMGDWIEVDGHTGKVIEMTWRAVRLIGTDGVTVVVPNGNIAGDAFRNYSAPDSWFRDEIRVPLPFSVSTAQGRRILMSAVSEIPELAAYAKKPKASIAEYNDRGIIWRVLYWVPDYARLASLRFSVHQNILRNMHFSGIHLPVPSEQVHVLRNITEEELEPCSLVRTLRNIPLFNELADEDLAHLAQAAHQQDITAGQTVIRQGDDGASLFLLNEGLLSVSVSTPDGSRTEVGQIIAGNAFGEMSLLTGAPRGATVTAVMDSLVTEIHKDAMAKLLSARPHVAEILSRILAERQMSTDRRVAASGQHQATDDGGVASHFLARIRAFFNLPATVNA